MNIATRSLEYHFSDIVRPHINCPLLHSVLPVLISVFYHSVPPMFTLKPGVFTSSEIPCYQTSGAYYFLHPIMSLCNFLPMFFGKPSECYSLLCKYISDTNIWNSELFRTAFMYPPVILSILQWNKLQLLILSCRIIKSNEGLFVYIIPLNSTLLYTVATGLFIEMGMRLLFKQLYNIVVNLIYIGHVN